MECGATDHTGGLPGGRRRRTASILAGIAAGLLCGVAQAQETKKLSWTPPTERVDGSALSADQLAAHRVLCEPGVDVSVPMPATSWAGVEPGIESCVVRAVDQDGLESVDSARVYPEWETEPGDDPPGAPTNVRVVAELPPSTGPPSGGPSMSQFFTDFDELTPGLGVPSGFTVIGNQSIRWEIFEGAAGDNSLGIDGDVGSYTNGAIITDSITFAGQTEIYVEVQGDHWGTNRGKGGVIWRASFSNNATTGYIAHISREGGENYLALKKLVNVGLVPVQEGFGTDLDKVAFSSLGFSGQDAIVKISIVDNGGLINVFAWETGDKPATPTLSYDDQASVLSGDGVGPFVGQVSGIDVHRWYAFGVGTNGDSAPSEPVSGGTTVEAGLATGAEAGAGFNARVVSRADISAATSAGATHGASSTIRAAISEGATAQQVASGVASMAAQLAESTLAGAEATARATLAASITEGAGAGEAVSRQAATLEQMVAAAEADALLSAYLQAVATLAAGVEAGDAWAARLTAAATFSGAAEASGTFSEDSVALIAAESEAGAHFAAAVHALAEQLEGAAAGAAMAGIVSTLAAFSSASSAGAVFESAMRHADALQASAEAGAAFAGVTGELTGHLLESVSAAMVVNSAHQARATWSATAHAGASFVASGDVSALIGALAFVVAAEQRVFTVPAETRTFIVS